MSAEDYLQHHETIKASTILVKDFDTAISNVRNSETIQVLCIVRNGKYYIDDFIQYHKKLGVSTFTFIDNCSTDNTIKLASAYPYVRIFKNELPYKIYWHHFKRFMFEEYGKGCWNLVLDIDEFFEGPFQDELNLHDLVEYNNQANFTAVVTQMVDLIPNENIIAENKGKGFINTHIYYSADNIKVEPYENISPKNIISNLLINFNLCGWRDKTFNVGDIMLTKHSFIKGDGKLKYVHDHFVENAIIADYSCILKHYKFGGNFKEYVKKSVKEENHFDNSREYKKYQSRIKENDNLNLYEKKMLNINNKKTLFINSFFEISTLFLVYFEHKIKFNDLKILFLEKSKQSNQLKNEELKKLRFYHNDYPRLKTEMDNIKKSYTWKIARFFTKSIGLLVGKK